MDFKSLWDAFPDVVMVAGDSQGILYGNRAAEAVGLGGGGQLPQKLHLAADGTSLCIELRGVTYHFAVAIAPLGARIFSGRDATSLKRDQEEELLGGSDELPGTAGGDYSGTHRGVERRQAMIDLAYELREKSELLASILGQMGEGVAAADTSGRILVWNSAAAQILNIPAPTHIRDFEDFDVSNPEGAARQIALRRALRGKEVTGEELFIRHPQLPDGVWVTVTARSLRDGKGGLRGAVSVFRDSTGQRQLKETLAQARDAAVQATRMKSEFLANMSHEIRTPLNGIIGLGELLAATALDQAQREYLTTVRLCSKSLLSIVNNVLDFSKIEAGKAELALESFLLEPMVEEALELAATGLESPDVEMYARLRPELPTQVVGDPHRLRQILLNFLANAAKFTSSGHIVLEVQRVEQNDHSVLLCFSVHDTGPGIHPNARQRLFQPFSQVDSSSKRVHGGTGLGLVICRKLAEMMGGDAGFSSVMGAGSTFYFTARLATVSPATPPRSLNDLPAVVLRLSNPGLQETVHEYLESRGARVNNDLASGSRLLILDHESELGSGVDIPADVRLIFLGHSRPTQHGSQLSFLRKPLKFSRLVSLLRDVGRTSHDSGRRASLLLPHAEPALHGRVLVAEDNPVNRRVLLLMLQKMGLQVAGAENGQVAVEAALTGQHDLVLMDCQMPVMDGYEATISVRERWTSSNRLPIIAVTANALEGEAERCRDCGMDDYLAKPITADSLRAILERWLPAAVTSDS